MTYVFRQTLRALFFVLLLSFFPASDGWPQESASSPGRPALLEFGAGYCISCKEMEKVMGELRSSHGDQLEVRMVYVGKENEIFKKYKIMLIPTQVFLDAGGQEVFRHVGALTKDEVLKKLRELKFIR